MSIIRLWFPTCNMEKNTHGGKREGAGRKAKPSREVLYARVAEGTVAKLRTMAETQGCTVGDIIEKLIKK